MTRLLWSLLKFFLDNVRFLVVLTLVVTGLGWVSYTQWLEKEYYPEVGLSQGFVTIRTEAEDPEILYAETTRPLENVLARNDLVSEFATTTSTNQLNFVITFDETQPRAQAILQLERQLNDAEAKQGQNILIKTQRFSQYFGTYDTLVTLSSEDSEGLESQAQNFAQRLLLEDEVLLADVLDVETTLTTKHAGTTRQSVPATFVGVSSKENSLELFRVVEQVKQDYILEESAAGVTVTTRLDPANEILQNTALLENNIVSAVFGIALILHLLINWRTSLVGALFIPIVCAQVYLGLYFLGETLNAVSLFGLILVLGLFVDDAIVMLESLDYHLRRTTSLEAGLRATVAEVGSANLVGTATTVLVFVPMFFISGSLGRLIYQIPLVVILALLCSVVTSFILVPTLSSRPFLWRRTTLTKYINLGYFLLIGGGHYYFTGEEWLLRLSLGILVGLFSVLIVRSLLAKVRGQSTKPELLILDDIVVWLQGQTTRIVRTLLERYRWLTLGMVVVTVGCLGYLGVAFTRQIGFSVFGIPKDADKILIIYQPSVALELEHSEVARIVSEVTVESLGGELEELGFVGGVDESGLRAGVDARGFVATAYLTPRVERENSARTSRDRLQASLDEEFNGQVSTLLFTPGPVDSNPSFTVEARGLDPNTARQLLIDMQSYLQDNAPDGVVAQIEDDSVINARNGKRVERLRVFFPDEFTDTEKEQVALDIDDRFGPLLRNDYPLVVYDFDYGVAEENNASFRSALYALSIALGAMYLLLLTQYQSFLKPLLIYVAILLAIPGVLVGLYLTSNPFGFFVVIGFLGLCGIVVNNSIMIVDQIQQGQAAGLSVRAAIAQATGLRLRAIIATSLTTAIGLLPLALSEPFWEPLAVTIISGVASSTVLLVGLFPFLYYFSVGIFEEKNTSAK